MPASTPRQPLRVLIVEDSVADAELLIHELTRAGYALTTERVDTEEAMRAALTNASWDLVVSDYSMPTFSAPSALGVLQATGHHLPFIIVSGTIGEETAVAALKAGAHDFLVKGRLARLVPAIERELREAALRRERQQLEEQLRQAQKMEAIGQLAGGIAHDFNNMLTSILGYTDLLLEQIGSDKPIGRDLHEIRAAAQRASALTRQLLAFSRKQVLTVAPVDLTEVVRALEPMLRRLLGERITIQTHLADDLYLVMGDATQLEHLLVNLAVNARDAMPEGGTITIATRNVDVDQKYLASHRALSLGSFAMMSVSDTGTGMSSEVLARIFEPFFTTKERGRGTGLGLAAVYGTVKQLGGSIDVLSQLDAGSTFAIYLPRTDRARPAPQIAAPASSPTGSETILLVEDEPGVRAFVSTVLRRFGYQVIEAEHAEAALSMLEGKPRKIHLLLTDVVLPAMSGPQLAARLMQLQPDVRVLLMSGYADDREQPSDRVLERGGWIEKPFLAQTLLHRIRRVLGSPSGR